MEQPEGFITPGQENKVCRLHKCIYGLKQASHVWGNLFMDFIEQHGFKKSDADPCLFFRIRGTERTFLAIWVDDGIVASNHQKAIDGFITALGENFKFRSHPLQRYVGITITRDREQRKIHISQPEFISQIVEKFHMTSCSPKSIPADPNVLLTKPTDKKEEERDFPYREAVGVLLYLALVSRPDISFAVGQVARFVESHNPSHVKAIRQIISYIHGTPSHGICFLLDATVALQSGTRTPTMQAASPLDAQQRGASSCTMEDQSHGVAGAKPALLNLPPRQSM